MGPHALPASASCRVLGARHQREGKICQDAVLIERTENLVAMAVADGHGSCSHSDIGAALAVETAVASLREFAASLSPSLGLHTLRIRAQEALSSRLVERWTKRAQKAAHEAAQPLTSFGSTLLFALATPEYLLLGQLGDGDMLLVSGDKTVRKPIAPARASIGEETSSLCQNEAWKELVLVALAAPSPGSLLLVSTDGYSKSYETDAIFKQIGPDYLTMITASGLTAVSRELPRFLETVTSQGSGDDVTLGLLYWPAHAPTRPGFERAHLALPVGCGWLKRKKDRRCHS